MKLSTLARCAAVVSAALVTGTTLHAQVVRGAIQEILSRRPLAGVSVSLLDVRDSVFRTATTDRSGNFRFNAVPANSYSISIRAIGFEPMVTTPFRVIATDTIVLAFTLQPSVTSLDTVKVNDKPLFGVTLGRAQFMEHYRRGVGLFISGAEIAASRKGIADYIATLPGFTDYGGGKPPASIDAASCQSLNVQLRGGNLSLSTGRTPAEKSRLNTDDYCSLVDDMGRKVFSVDAPCVISQVDRIGWVRRVAGTDVIVQPHQLGYTPSGPGLLAEPDAGTRPEIIVHLREVIGVEFFRTPSEIPDNLRIRGQTAEAEVKTARCGLIQFWTRTAW